MNGHRGGAVWFTGLPGSGKTALAGEVERRLHARGIRTTLLDGDNLRHGLNHDLGLSAADRAENVRRASEVARLFADAGGMALLDATFGLRPSEGGEWKPQRRSLPLVAA